MCPFPPKGAAARSTGREVTLVDPIHYLTAGSAECTQSTAGFAAFRLIPARVHLEAGSGRGEGAYAFLLYIYYDAKRAVFNSFFFVYMAPHLRSQATTMMVGASRSTMFPPQDQQRSTILAFIPHPLR